VVDRLRAAWDFDDLDATALRFRELLDEQDDDEGRAEVLTQLARIDGLRGDFDAGDARLDQAIALSPAGAAARARIELERGRLRRSSGQPGAALPLFDSAFATALAGGEDFLAADAAHMAALASPEAAGFETWTQRGIDLAEAREGASYWLGPLLNNLGWHHVEHDRVDLALEAFERALRARERKPEDGDGIALARYAVGKTLRLLDRAGEAIPLLEEAVTWADRAGVPDGWYHEELAEEYAAVGRRADAREQARRAIPLLEIADPSFAEDEERRSRIDTLASP
jgi:tetratricopeptide (TPR) repeat protein